MAFTPLASTLHTLEPLLTFLLTIPLFHLTLALPPTSARYPLLPLHLLLPLHAYRTSHHLAALSPTLIWFAALTALTAPLHLLTTLYLDSWHLPTLHHQCPDRTPATVTLKAWMNLRRAPLQRHPGSHSPPLPHRLRFLARKSLEVLALTCLCIAIESAIATLLRPRAADFAPHHRGYLHFRLDRQARLRVCLALHWAWLSVFFIHVLHAGMAVVCVVVVGLDDPEDWPAMFGSPLQAAGLRRFWGRFWHKIAAPSQAVFGRVVARRGLGLRPGSAVEKAFLAGWVFVFAGVMHGFVNAKADAEADAWGDFRFLVLNFGGGLAEALVVRGIPYRLKQRLPMAAKRLVGFAWVYLFFYCTVPSYQWPEYYREARRREAGPGAHQL